MINTLSNNNDIFVATPGLSLEGITNV